MWKNLSQPNVPNIIGASDTLDDGRSAVISKWMVNGNVTALVGYNRTTCCRCSLGIFQIVAPLKD